jgi:hypothetical protein
MLNFDPSIQHSAAPVEITKTGENTFQARCPGGLAAFGRQVLDVISRVVTCGAYSYLEDTYNPRQWAQFRAAMVSTFGESEKGYWEQTKGTYQTSEALTQNKMNVIMADIEKAQRDGPKSLKERNPQRLEASQHFLARGLRTARERCRPPTELETAATKDASNLKDGNLRAGVLSILQPGREIPGSAVNFGQDAIKRRLKSEESEVVFDYVPLRIREGDSDPIDHVLDFSKNQEMDGVVKEETVDRMKEAANQGKRAILSIPLGLKDKSLGPKEDHFVELAVDFNSKKLLYLDARGTPIEDAPKRFGQDVNFKDALANFGKKVFGEDWDPGTGILQISCPKQQGANDCAAFTHDFTSRLVRGETVGDMERGFASSDRANLRVNMARAIIENHDPELDVDYSIDRGGEKNVPSNQPNDGDDSESDFENI